MPPVASNPTAPKILLIAASRGLGLAMAAEFLGQGWHVVGTVRSGSAHTKLHDLADQFAGRREIETLDICEQAEVTALRERLSGRVFEMLFVNAGVTNHDTETIGDVTTDEFVRVMVTNSLSPMRAIESLQDLVSADGLIGVMSSGQGSVANNVTGRHEVYRGSKAALNQFMRSYAARESGDSRAMVLMAPGWARTDLGGPDARLSIAESVPNLVSVLHRKRGRPGHERLSPHAGAHAAIEWLDGGPHRSQGTLSRVLPGVYTLVWVMWPCLVRRFLDWISRPAGHERRPCSAAGSDVWPLFFCRAIVNKSNRATSTSSGWLCCLPVCRPAAGAARARNDVRRPLRWNVGEAVRCMSAVGVPSVSAAYSWVRREELPMATTTLNIVMRIGGPTLTTICATFLGWRLGSAPDHDGLLSAFTAAFILLCGFHGLLIAATARFPASVAAA